MVTNTLGGKCNRGLSVVDTTRLLYGRELFESEFFEASTLGWLVEILQASLLIADDVMDEGVTRRGNFTVPLCSLSKYVWMCVW